MRADVIVLTERLVDSDLGLPDRGEPFAIEYLAAQCAVEAPIMAILPR